MHEFEALLFSDCLAFPQTLHAPDIAQHLQRQRDEFESPEEIDDSPETAPSKRIQSLLDRYEKPLMGVRGAQAIGLPKIREACPHFDSWLKKLEALGSESRGPQ